MWRWEKTEGQEKQKRKEAETEEHEVAARKGEAMDGWEGVGNSFDIATKPSSLN